MIAIEKRKTTIETPRIQAIEDFLTEWHKKAAAYHRSIADEYLVKLKEGEVFVERWNSAFKYSNPMEIRKECDEEHKKFAEWKLKNSSTMMMIRCDVPANWDKAIKKVLDREVERKRINFILRITKKAGNIIDASNLRIGMNSEINGIVKGSKTNVRVTTISAGGYNIQCFHYRVLVHEVK